MCSCNRITGFVCEAHRRPLEFRMTAPGWEGPAAPRLPAPRGLSEALRRLREAQGLPARRRSVEDYVAAIRAGTD